MRVLVAGMLAGDPGQGGASWAVLQYVRGLRRLGHDVMVVEPVTAFTDATAAYFGALACPRSALLRRGTRETIGCRWSELADFDAELLLNLSGLLRDSDLTGPIPTRVFIDLDPVFVQIWHAQGADMALAAHTHHVSLADELSATAVPIDRNWIPTLPPVVLDDWPFATELERDAFTTVGHWRSYGAVSWRGRTYGLKAHAVRRLIDLPRLTAEPLLTALAIHPNETDDLRALREHGWALADPGPLTATPAAYRRFIAGSRAELGLVKAGYADARCGWFSDRSACYLASGRPVVCQDTGFGRRLPVGAGLIAFSTVHEAAQGMATVSADYDRHRLAARAVAEQYLDSDRVLGRLLERVL